jgi:hypothetical protein
MVSSVPKVGGSEGLDISKLFFRALPITLSIEFLLTGIVEGTSSSSLNLLSFPRLDVLGENGNPPAAFGVESGSTVSAGPSTEGTVIVSATAEFNDVISSPGIAISLSDNAGLAG